MLTFIYIFIQTVHLKYKVRQLEFFTLLTPDLRGREKEKTTFKFSSALLSKIRTDVELTHEMLEIYSRQISLLVCVDVPLKIHNLHP